MMRKKMRVPMEPSSSTSYFAGGEDSMARLKHQLLLQDYQEVLKDVREKKEKMHKALQKRARLLAEVKFLRAKYHMLSISPQTLQLRSQKSRKPPSTASRKAKSQIAVTKPPKSLKRVRNQNTAPLLDLNQVSLPDAEEREGYEMDCKPLNVHELSSLSIGGGDALIGDVKLSICRDAGNGSNRVGNRRVSWQDQMALKV
ncbi:hypothetical protein HPP92_017733 [Vanilla planifolia]|nr:hypothetical protein HPP92_017733 [Vanilla planifolia]